MLRVRALDLAAAASANTRQPTQCGLGHGQGRHLTASAKHQVRLCGPNGSHLAGYTVVVNVLGRYVIMDADLARNAQAVAART